MLLNPEIISYTWANKPAIAPQGQTICITDIGDNGSLWRGDGTKWVRLTQIRFFDLSSSVALTGSTAEVTLATISIPAALIGAKGKVKLYLLFSATNNIFNKTVRVKLGGSTGYVLQTDAFAQLSALVIIRNFNSESVQKVATGMMSGLGSSTTTFNTLTINTAAATTIEITGQLSNSSNTLTLENLFMEIV